MYPYAFFKTSNGETWIESENWSMPCRVNGSAALSELQEFITKYPEREDSVIEEFQDWVYNLSNTGRKKLKRKWFKEEENNMHTISIAEMPSHTHSISLGSLPTVSWSQIHNPTPVCYNQEEGNNPMCYAAKSVTKIEEVNESTVLQDQRRFLLGQLDHAQSKFYRDFHKAFHMEPVGPSTIGEMVEWIKADKFEVKEEAKKHGYVGDFWYHVKWVDKANPPDETGYNKAKEAMEKAYNDAARVIKIKSPEAGLDALTAFESATFH